MRIVLFLMLIFPLGLRGQTENADPLSATLPSGRVVHFDTVEQKQKFEAAQQRIAAARTNAASPAAASPSPTAPSLSTPAEQRSSTGKVNINAPTFTAHYYMLAPETWEDKAVTLSVGYLRQNRSSVQNTGLVEFSAHTYGILQSTAAQDFGGIINIRATPAASQRILMLCGMTLQYVGSGMKMTLIKGTFKKEGDQYYVYVDK